jgi:anti-sigma B factor antagonist
VDQPERLGPALTGRLVRSEGVVTYRLDGDLDIAAREALPARLREIAARGDGELRLDLGGLTFMDSSGLRTLLETRALFEGDGRVLTLSDVSPEARRVIALTGSAGLLGLPEDDPGAAATA